MNKFSFALFLLISINTQGFGQMVTWTDNIPSSLQSFQNNPQQLANLAQDDIFIYSHGATKTSLPTLKSNPQPLAKFTSSAIVLPISTQEVAKILTNYSQYVGLFPTLKSAKILEQKGNISQVKYKISIPTPIPVLNFNENVTLQHQIGQNSISTLVIDAPIPYGVGKFEWFSLSNNKTLVTLTQWGDLNQPQGFLFKKILSAIPEVKLGIPSGTNAFILESLKNRYVTKKVITLNAGQFPTPQLNTAQLNKISQLSQVSQQPVSFVLTQSAVPYQHGNEMMRFTTTYQYYAQTPQQMQKWLQPSSYQSLFPRQIKKLTTSNQTAQGKDTQFKVSIGLGVISIPFDFKMHFNFPQSTENNFYANGGDLRFLKGQMQFLPEDNGSLFKMTTSVKIDKQAPFLLRVARSLPYHEMLPAVGTNAIFAQKIKLLNP